MLFKEIGSENVEWVPVLSGAITDVEFPWLSAYLEGSTLRGYCIVSSWCVCFIPQLLCDTVTICRSLDELGTNYLGKENSDLLSACVLSFASEGIGRRVSQMCVHQILTDFSGDSWNHNGPDLVTRVFKEVCGVDKVSTTALTAKRHWNNAPAFSVAKGPNFMQICTSETSSINKYLLQDVTFSQRWAWRVLIFWDVTPWSLVEVHQYFGETYCLHFQDRRVS
jgi:hypothetical protein